MQEEQSRKEDQTCSCRLVYPAAAETVLFFLEAHVPPREMLMLEHLIS